MDESKIVFVDEEGNEKEYDILFTFESKETGKNYVVVVCAQENGEAEITAACYVENDDVSGSILPIETEEEWAMVEETIDAYFEQNIEE